MPWGYGRIWTSNMGNGFECDKCHKIFPYNVISNVPLILCEDCHGEFKIMYKAWKELKEGELPLVIPIWKYDELVADRKNRDRKEQTESRVTFP